MRDRYPPMYRGSNRRSLFGSPFGRKGQDRKAVRHTFPFNRKRCLGLVDTLGRVRAAGCDIAVREGSLLWYCICAKLCVPQKL